MTNTTAQVPTKLHERQSFERALEESLKQEETVTLALVDVDNFMAVNQRHGRDVGDRVLDQVADLLVGVAGEMDGFAGRVGGDEFALALAGTSLEAAFLRLERFRVEFAAAAPALLPKGDAAPLSVSVGLANFPRDARTIVDLTKRADQALWQAKESGRNQVALPAAEDMILKSNYYTAAQLGRLKRLAEQKKRKESVLLREALDDLLRKYDVK